MTSPRHAGEPGRHRTVARTRLTRRGRVVLSLLGVLALSGGYAGLAYSAAPPAATLERHLPEVIVEEGAAVDLPGYGASALQLVADGDGTVVSDGAIVTRGSEGLRPMASITKLITALVVLESHPLAPGEDGPDITFDARAASYYSANIARNGSVIALQQGQTVSLKEAITVSLMESANNWTEALADWSAGSQEAFLVEARDWLERNGFERTVMTNVVGWQGNESTTTELLHLGQLALAHPVIAEIVAIEDLAIPGVGALENSNEILGDSGVDGLKTGSLGGRFNLLFSAVVEIDGEQQRLIGVILGAPSKERLYADVRDALDSVPGAVSRVSIGAVGDEVATWSTEWGASSGLVLDEATTVSVWGATEVELSLSASTLVPGERSSGTLTASVGSAERTLALSAGEELAEPDLWWRLANPFG